MNSLIMMSDKELSQRHLEGLLQRPEYSSLRRVTVDSEEEFLRLCAYFGEGDGRINNDYFLASVNPMDNLLIFYGNSCSESGK